MIIGLLKLLGSDNKLIVGIVNGLMLVMIVLFIALLAY